VWPSSFKFPHQKPLCIYILPSTCYMPCPPHPNYIRRAVQIVKLLIMSCYCVTCHFLSLRPKHPPCVTCHFLSLRPKHPPQHPILKHPQPLFFPRCERDQVSHPYKTTGKITALHTLVLFRYKAPPGSRYWPNLTCSQFIQERTFEPQDLNFASTSCSKCVALLIAVAQTDVPRAPVCRPLCCKQLPLC